MSQAPGRSTANASGELDYRGATLRHRTWANVCDVSHRQAHLRRRSRLRRLQALSFRSHLPHASVITFAAMKIPLILLLALISFVLVTQEKESKVQPKEVTLAKDSQSDKYGEVAFNHENHEIRRIGRCHV